MNTLLRRLTRVEFQPRVSLVLAALALGALGNLVAAFVGLPEPFGLALTLALGNAILFSQQLGNAVRATVQSVRAHHHTRVASAPTE